jgi:hypothetical protein
MISDHALSITKATYRIVLDVITMFVERVRHCRRPTDRGQGRVEVMVYFLINFDESVNPGRHRNVEVPSKHLVLLIKGILVVYVLLTKPIDRILEVIDSIQILESRPAQGCTCLFRDAILCIVKSYFVIGIREQGKALDLPRE